MGKSILQAHKDGALEAAVDKMEDIVDKVKAVTITTEEEQKGTSTPATPASSTSASALTSTSSTPAPSSAASSTSAATSTTPAAQAASTTPATPAATLVEPAYALPKMRIESWSLLVMDRRLYFQFIFMESMLLVWVGRKQPAMGQLCLALNTPFDSVPSATALLGESDGFSQVLSQKIASRTGMTVFVSLNSEQ